MAKTSLKPIGLHDEGKSSQNYDVFKSGEKISTNYFNLKEFISQDENNVLITRADGFFVGGCAGQGNTGGRPTPNDTSVNTGNGSNNGHTFPGNGG